MKNTKNKFVLFLMILTVTVSGCTGGNQEEDEGSSSISVNSFSAFPNPVPAGQNAQFRMELVNNGEADAGNVYARLYNPPFGGTGDMVWKNVSKTMDKEYRTLKFGTLRAAGDQTPAVPKTRQKDFEAPSLGEDREVSYTFNSNIVFNYSTTGTAKVEILGETEYRDQGSPQGSAGLENSKAPVQMEVRTPTPIPIYDSSGNKVKKQFCVIVRNQGSGKVFDPTVAPNSTEKDFSMSNIQDTQGELQLNIPDVGRTNFSNPDHPERNWQNVSILNGRGIGCFDMEISGVSDTFQTTIPIRVDADYGYMKGARANIRVEGR